MTTFSEQSTDTLEPQRPVRRTGRWIEDWRHEDPDFWEATGR